MRPLVFISHSSRDAEVVRRLQHLLTSRTSNTIRLFVSSDQLSIPAGKMWIEQIFDALSTTSLAFVLLSPNSMQSQWIPFEVGLCYSRKIRTIPVGMLGVDATAISPPLGLLQGFNLDSAAGLERIVAEINETFEHSHATTCTTQEYASLWDTPVLPLPDGEHKFRVFTMGEHGEQAHEMLQINVHESTMVVRSAHRATWESLGIFERNRYFGRFRFFRGSSTDDLGVHDFTWDGREFVGSAKLDSGRWSAENLIWRPVEPIGES